ncbi:hypothetical protein FJZ17_01945 [Candidatus Pacearchaeota archaeon]|nr:hypothetical protein [Candidatus Pacearchaeota archaeon]
MAGKLLWNFRANPQERQVSYFFVLGFPDSRDIATITSRILNYFAPTDNHQQRDGTAGNTKYRVLCFDAGNIAPPEPAVLSGIFRGKVRRDERLYLRERTGMDGLEAYARREIAAI